MHFKFLGNGPLNVLRCVRLSQLTPCESQFDLRTSCDMQCDFNYDKELKNKRVQEENARKGVFVCHGSQTVNYGSNFGQAAICNETIIMARNTYKKRAQNGQHRFFQVLHAEFPQSSKKRRWQDYSLLLGVYCMGLVPTC